MTSEFLLPLGWIISGGFVPTLIICLVICPGMPQLLGLVLDGYWVPWNPKYQFLAFVPGNPCLALFIASTSSTYYHTGFSIPAWLNYTIIIGAFVLYVILTVQDLGSRYTVGQMKSATKVYHNSLYFWYGYLAVVSFAAMMLSAPVDVATKIVATIPGVLWLGCMVADNFASEATLKRRFIFAHAESVPIWKTNWMPRRRTSSGYEIRGSSTQSA